uniref:Uncharacterized protein n=1 Tax=Davidia involucrata TaxID=16924 RepID=A0A5B6YJ06_DAVIN
MTKFNCFCGLVGSKKKDEGDKGSLKTDDFNKGLKTLQVRLERPSKSSEANELNSTSFTVPVPFGIPGNSRCKVKVMSHESPVKGEGEAAYEGEDEHDENMSLKRDYSDFDLHAHVADSNDQSVNKEMNFYDSFDTKINDQLENKTEKDAEDMIQSGHVSDPGIGKAEFWASPKLKRSCSNLEMGDVLKEIADQLPLSKSQSFEESQRLAERLRTEVHPGSPRSVVTHCSADKVMLKKHSSSQVLPSRSRRSWWKLFLWSHRNLHAPWTAKPRTLPMNQQGGYSSDTLEPNIGSTNYDNQSWDGFNPGVSGLWPQNQWVAFPAESSFTRVDEWVKEVATQTPLPVNDGGIVFPPSPDTGRSPARSTSHLSQHPNMNLPEEIVHANNVIQSLNSSSTVAHIRQLNSSYYTWVSAQGCSHTQLVQKQDQHY